MSIVDLPGQGLLQLEELGLAFVLSALVGLERELRQKSAGLRTYTRPVAHLIAALADIDGVVRVGSASDDGLE